MTEDPKDATLVAELIDHEWAPGFSVRLYAIARCRSKHVSIAVDQISSAAASGSSSTRRPPIDRRMRSPPTTPMRTAGSPADAAIANSSESWPGATDTTARDA